MRPLIKASVAASVVALAVLAPSWARAADADSYPPVDSEALRREDVTTFGPAAGAEIGSGAVYPAFGAPVLNILGRLGFSLSLRSNVALSFGGETGLALSIGNGAPTYGYLLRLPLRAFGEVIFSQQLDYRTRKYMNLHAGGSAGNDFLLSSQCESGACSYVPASLYTGFGLRIGLSYSQFTRSALGIFMRWDNDVAQCAGLKCNQYIQTYTWDLGWTLF